MDVWRFTREAAAGRGAEALAYEDCKARGGTMTLTQGVGSSCVMPQGVSPLGSGLSSRALLIGAGVVAAALLVYLAARGAK